MNSNFYKSIIDQSPVGYAYHKIIVDEMGIPCDYEFIETNASFDKYTGLNGIEIVGKRITEVIPGFRNNEFDWINFYGEIALNGGEKEFEQFSKHFNKWYRVSVYSPEKTFFITRIIDISKETKKQYLLKRMGDFSEELLQLFNEKLDYQKITDNFLELSEAKFAIFNLYDNDGKSYTTMAISGDHGNINLATKILGMNVSGQKWEHEALRADKIKNNTVTRFSSINDIMMNSVPESISILLAKTFDLGQAVIVKIAKDNVILGDFTFIMSSCKSFDNDIVVDLYSKQLGLAIIRQRVEVALFEEKALTDAIFNSIPGYIYLYNTSGKLIRWNKQHEEMTGYTTEELSHMTMDKWFAGEDAIRVAAAIEDIFKKGYGEVEADLLIKDGKKLPILSNGVPLTIRGETYFTGIGIDITEQRKAKQELLEREHYLRTILETTQDGFLVVDAMGHINDVNEAYCRMSGYTRKELLAIMLQDLEKTESAQEVVIHIRRVIKNRSELFETQHKRKNGSFFSVEISVMCMESYNHIVMVCFCRDITERKKAEEALRERDKLFVNITSQVPGVLFQFVRKPDGTFLVPYSSIGIKEVFGCTPEDVKNTFDPIFKVVLPEDQNKVIQTIEESTKNLSPWLCEYRVQIPGESAKWILGNSVPEKMADGSIIWSGYDMDITELKIAEENLIHLSYHDYLTGLYNRRFFEEELTRLDTKRNLPISIVMCDLNGLKLVNDSFGHALGDQLLRKAAEVIKKECRADDIIARFGGDEFVIILPKTDTRCTEQIVNRLNAQAVKEKVGGIEVSISFGYDTKTLEKEIILEKLTNAENHMYRHKLYQNSSMRSKTVNLIMEALFEKSAREMMHSTRVSEICEVIARNVHIDNININQIRTAGLMHDIGKIGIEESILNKTQSLNHEEWNEIKRHPEVGWRILSSVIEFSELARFILEHHERWDGKGYPKGLKGNEISVEARIIAIADSYDAMTSMRSYRTALKEEEAISEIKKCSGTQFDPEIAGIFLEKVLKKV